MDRYAWFCFCSLKIIIMLLCWCRGQHVRLCIFPIVSRCVHLQYNSWLVIVTQQGALSAPISGSVCLIECLIQFLFTDSQYHLLSRDQYAVSFGCILMIVHQQATSAATVSTSVRFWYSVFFWFLNAAPTYNSQTIKITIIWLDLCEFRRCLFTISLLHPLM